MNKTTNLVLLIAGVILGSATVAIAQPPPPTKNIFVDVNFGAQPSSRTFSVEAFPVVYGEVAIVRANQEVNGGGLTDVIAGYRVWNNVSVALGFTTTLGTSSAANVTGGIPHPLFYDTRIESSQSVADLSHKERSVHISAMWTSPVTDKIDASVMAGPSYIKVFQDLVNGVQVPPGTQSFIALVDEQTATTVGFHFGGELTYLFTPPLGSGAFAPRVGAGVMVRFVKAKADLPSVPDLDIAGFQIGGGVRFRF